MAFDAFLKIDGIKGESTDKGHSGEIEIESFSWGVSAPTSNTGGGAGVGKVVFSDLTIVKVVDTASPALFSTADSGKLLPAVQLTCRKAGEKQQEFLVVKLTDATVSSYREGGNRHGGEFPTEEIAFSFHKIEMNVGR
ncbi:MAG: hypothetical protein JWN14_4448 [Chthonomonadales bacterium]|nr:hypothetical protein [Chthonomonadales bacterium]